jgi:hypothetical protein
MPQTVEICLPNLVGFVEGNAPMIFFTPLNVREVELRGVHGRMGSELY